MRKEIIRKVMESVTAEFLANLIMHDDRPKPYFEWDINCGECEAWAYRVEKELKALGIKSETIGNDQFPRLEELPFHVFLRIGRKYYDCECLEGVTRIKSLPIYSRNVDLDREEARVFYKKAA